MKLTMKNNFSFQKAEGYLDDPDAMSTDEVKEHLAYWHGMLEGMVDEGGYPGDLVYLSSFVKSLADGEVEYEESLKKVTIEEIRNKEIWVDADDFDDALEIVERNYKNGLYDMRSGDVEVHASVGDSEHDFCEIAEWYC